MIKNWQTPELKQALLEYHVKYCLNCREYMATVTELVDYNNKKQAVTKCPICNKKEFR